MLSEQELISSNHLVFADNLELLSIIPDSVIDLAYIDPPFGTGKHRSTTSTSYPDEISDPALFLQLLTPRLQGLWRILKPSGSIVIHLDSRSIHHIRLWCDANFGESHWENEIIWHYTGGGRSKNRFSRKHDVLLWYSKSPARTFNIEAIRQPYNPDSGYAKSGIVSKSGKRYMPDPAGTPVDDVWDIPIVNPMSSERTSYPTQKPLKLIERIISSLSSPGDLVCDIFSGSGTTALASISLNRHFLCCDTNTDAILTTLSRLSPNHDFSLLCHAPQCHALQRMGSTWHVIHRMPQS